MATALLPPSMAGLPCSNATVSSGPPLLANPEASPGATPTWLPLAPLVNPPEDAASPIKLDVLVAETVPAMSLAVAPGPVPMVLSATIVLSKVVPAEDIKPAAGAAGGGVVVGDGVVDERQRARWLKRPPPSAAELPEKVVLVAVRRPSFSMPPPLSTAELAAKSESKTIAVPVASLSMPPPEPAELSARLPSVTVSVPRLSIAPPLSPAELFEKLELVTVNVLAAWLSIPPPIEAVLPSAGVLPPNWVDVTVSVPELSMPPPLLVAALVVKAEPVTVTMPAL